MNRRVRMYRWNKRADEFSHLGAPKPGEKGYKPVPKSDVKKEARRMWERTQDLIEDPEFASDVREWREGVGSGMSGSELADLVSIPYQVGGRKLTKMDREDFLDLLLDLALSRDARQHEFIEELRSGRELRRLAKKGIKPKAKYMTEGISSPDSGMPDWLAESVIEDALRWVAEGKKKTELRIVNIPLAEAEDFIFKHHTALPDFINKGVLFSIGIKKGNRLVAVAVAGTPGGNWNEPYNVLELFRVASDGTVRGASSMLTARIIKLLEQSKRGDPSKPAKFITYSLLSEEGTTYKALKGMGLHPTMVTRPKLKPSGSRKKAGGLKGEAKIRWESGPGAASPDWSVLEAIQPGRRGYVPRKMAIYFASGTHNAGEIRGFVDKGVDVGTVVQECETEACRREYARALAKGRNVFVDSGAFSEMKFHEDRPPEVVKPLGPKAWDEIFQTYYDIAERGAQAIAPTAKSGQALSLSNLYLVAPDRIGDQKVTYERMKKYIDILQDLIATYDVSLILPVQKGPHYTMAQFQRGLKEMFPRSMHKNLVWGIPMKSDATSMEEIKEFLKTAKPKRVHLLGMSPNSPRWPEIKKMIYGWTQRKTKNRPKKHFPGAAPYLDLSMDAVRLTALGGYSGKKRTPRALTARKMEAAEELRSLVQAGGERERDELRMMEGETPREEGRRKEGKEKIRMRTWEESISRGGSGEWDLEWLTDDQARKVAQSLLREADSGYVGGSPDEWNVTLLKKAAKTGRDDLERWAYSVNQYDWHDVMEMILRPHWDEYAFQVTRYRPTGTAPVHPHWRDEAQAFTAERTRRAIGGLTPEQRGQKGREIKEQVFYELGDPDGGPPQIVLAYEIEGVWGAHADEHGAGYKIAHIPTGRVLPLDFRSKTAVMKVLKGLGREVRDMGKNMKLNGNLKKKELQRVAKTLRGLL